MIKDRFIKVVKKDCLSQDRFIYEFRKKVDESAIRFLQKFGKVKVYQEFAIPLVAMDVPDKMRLTTLFGSKKIDIFYKEKRPRNFIDRFEKELNKYLE
jgi:hypothetical protein